MKSNACALLASPMRRNFRVLIVVPAVCASLMLLEASSAEEAKAPTTHASGSSNAPKTIDWSYLAPENGRPFNDPFAKLTSDQLADLGYVARVRRLIAEEKIGAEGDDAKEAIRLSTNLTQQGIDINWLLVQRQRIPEIRKQQIDAVAKSVAKSLKSKTVELVGFATPVPGQRDGATTFLLMPTAAMCGHSTAPSPLQVANVETKREYSLRSQGTPVRVSGEIVAEATLTPLVTSSGVQSFASAYKIVPSTIDILTPTSGTRNVTEHDTSSSR